ncbi:predicted protein [Botrytis cinerea T4]|uniref:Uncharacterized protein n=1 Tax=Botryotinia fuckeliana (strain T4) TaxID=999810 RepID=G2Y803_BOTF4|nr:predicted protein [Botrytis cinerea T4]
MARCSDSRVRYFDYYESETFCSMQAYGKWFLVNSISGCSIWTSPLLDRRVCLLLMTAIPATSRRAIQRPTIESKLVERTIQDYGRSNYYSRGKKNFSTVDK